ncbi:MAG: histidinol dehydrogenase [bacterium]
MLTVLDRADADFERALAKLLARDDEHARAVEREVAEIIKAVRRDGDAALLELTARFDGASPTDAAALELPREAIDAALEQVPMEVADALRAAAERIERFHRREIAQSWSVEEPDGTRLGQRVGALARVGVYVPGGKAAYPSSALMTVIPARVAGVGEIVMAMPARDGAINPAALAAAALAGVDRVFALGGAQAIAALAYGTATVPAVDKIVGPGNAFVAAAKRQVFGQVGIDSIAGPSEVVVVCDQSADSDWVAMDLFAQAEHDQRAQSIAITDSDAMIAAIRSSVEKLLPQMARREIIARALESHGALIKATDLRDAIAISNRIAPEHLELMVAQPQPLLDAVGCAGAIFVGAHSAEVFGDYCAGPNHVLPTAGAARFASPLGVHDFQKRSSVIELSARGAARLAPLAATLARCEGLDAHARSAEYRLAAPTNGGDDDD